MHNANSTLFLTFSKDLDMNVTSPNEYSGAKLVWFLTFPDHSFLPENNAVKCKMSLADQWTQYIIF